MLAVRVVCVGNLKETYWREAVAEYEKRLRSLCQFSIVTIPEVRLPQEPSRAQIMATLDREGERLLQKTVGKCFSLCIEGRELSSENLAERLNGAMQSPGAVTFFIGSSFGLSDKVKSAGERLSMSPMTFPHQLARVMLCEQIYRALQIINGTKYHK